MKLYHFVYTILSVPFCPIPFCPYTILSATILSGHPNGSAGSVGLLLLLDLFLISVALQHYSCLFNMTKSCVWHLPVYLSASVSAEGVVKLSAPVSVSAESQFMTFGRVLVSAETRNSVSVGL